VQLHQTVHVIRHHNPRQKISPAFHFCLTQLLNNQPPQSPINKKRLPLVNDSRYQINTPWLREATNTQMTSIQADRHSIAS
jgi:hypothetical protein